ncbi:cellulase [Salegentibacter salinarum]|uniref:Endoglucanase n=1 Tax=Salegentibacter salinarum TaxID=447422 RepID=A0A2N0U145_9FLAO|nr:glycoside hydrolase family 9 protein [Salegentibacter salinarum]PKD20723.1 cellulase [Salegentibacter salinarum]SKB81765.1 endoglucanase [Salegentibacter salinarum]
MRPSTIFLIPVLCFFLNLSAFGQPNEENSGSEKIRINQVGFYPHGQKIAIVVTSEATDFYILTADEKNEVFSGKLSDAKEWVHSKETVKQADFSLVENSGKYVLRVPGIGSSHPFEINENVHFEPAKASMKAFYFQRASTDLPEEYAGKWAREAGHPDDQVKVHNSAASEDRPTGSTISSTGGWYDAGDYGKYIVNSGITMGTLFSLYEDFPEYLDTLNLNILESTNNIPDFLDETLYNLRWMMTMQDEDGGVYHKLTSATFHGAVAPKDATFQRWVVQKSTAATLDFSAVTAQAARIFQDYKNELPGLSDSLLVMSEKAYRWAKDNPEVIYHQGELKDPEISTGAYGDQNIKDELQWAATELFIATGKEVYYKDADLENSLESDFSIPSWPNVNTLALYSLARHRDKYQGSQIVNIDAIIGQLTKMADDLVSSSKTSAYAIPMGIEESDFVWGSNSTAANQGILLLNVYKITDDEKYLDAANDNLDYLLGRNATGFSFLTGYGEKSTRDPHHRPSESDDNEDPVPGLLAGGPNPGQQDKEDCGDKYTAAHQHPATSYIDDRCSYASNEIAINWNTPFVYLANAIEAIREAK